MVLPASAAKAGAYRSGLPESLGRGRGRLSSSPLSESNAPWQNLVGGTPFPGYLIAHFALAEKQRAVSYAAGVSGILRFGESVPTVAACFVEELRAELAREEGKGEVITLQPVAEPGDQVELADGPLRGMTGTVLEVRPAEERVRIFIEFLGQAQPIDVDLYSLLLPRKVSRPPGDTNA